MKTRQLSVIQGSLKGSTAGEGAAGAVVISGGSAETVVSLNRRVGLSVGLVFSKLQDKQCSVQPMKRIADFRALQLHPGA